MDLKILGLSEYEEKAYRTLVNLGKSNASAVSREGNVSYGKVYEVLASLERKGFVKVIPEKTKMFVAENPKKIIEIVMKKQDQLIELKKEIKGLEQVYETRTEEVVQMVKGKRNFYKIIRNLKEPKEFKYSIKYSSEFNPEWARQDEALKKKGVELKSLNKYDEETKGNVKKWLKIHKNIKKIENKGIAIDIRESELIITLIKNNTIMLFNDPALIKIMKRLFLETYKNADKIE